MWAILLLISVALMAEGVVLITQLVDGATESGAFRYNGGGCGEYRKNRFSGDF